MATGPRRVRDLESEVDLEAQAGAARGAVLLLRPTAHVVQRVHGAGLLVDRVDVIAVAVALFGPDQVHAVGGRGGLLGAGPVAAAGPRIGGAAKGEIDC